MGYFYFKHKTMSVEFKNESRIITPAIHTIQDFETIKANFSIVDKTRHEESEKMINSITEVINEYNNSISEFACRRHTYRDDSPDMTELFIDCIPESIRTPATRIKATMCRKCNYIKDVIMFNPNAHGLDPKNKYRGPKLWSSEGVHYPIHGLIRDVSIKIMNHDYIGLCFRILFEIDVFCEKCGQCLSSKASNIIDNHYSVKIDYNFEDEEIEKIKQLIQEQLIDKLNHSEFINCPQRIDKFHNIHDLALEGISKYIEKYFIALGDDTFHTKKDEDDIMRLVKNKVKEETPTNEPNNEITDDYEENWRYEASDDETKQAKTFDYQAIDDKEIDNEFFKIIHDNTIEVSFDGDAEYADFLAFTDDIIYFMRDFKNGVLRGISKEVFDKYIKNLKLMFLHENIELEDLREDGYWSRFNSVPEYITYDSFIDSEYVPSFESFICPNLRFIHYALPGANLHCFVNLTDTDITIHDIYRKLYNYMLENAHIDEYVENISISLYSNSQLELLTALIQKMNKRYETTYRLEPLDIDYNGLLRFCNGDNELKLIKNITNLTKHNSYDDKKPTKLRLIEALFQYKQNYKFKSWFRCPNGKSALVYKHPKEKNTNYILSSNTNLHNELIHKPEAKNIFVVRENITPEKTNMYERVPLSQFI